MRCRLLVIVALGASFTLFNVILMFYSLETQEIEDSPIKVINTSIHVVTQWYVDQNTTRDKEICRALVENIENNVIDKIHLLHGAGENVRGLGLYLATEFGIHARDFLQKVVFHQYNHPGRLLVSDALEYANKHLKDAVVIFANTDISFDDSLRILLKDQKLLQQNEVYFLSR